MVSSKFSVTLLAQAEPEGFPIWRKILNFLLENGQTICDVEKQTRHKYDAREWTE
jgi:hypothetical protein